MQFSILKNEWQLLRADNTFLVVVLLFATMMTYAVYNSTQWVDFQQENLELVEEETQSTNNHLKTELQQIIQSGEARSIHNDPGYAAFVGLGKRSSYATLPPKPLAAVAVGQSDLQPYYNRVTASKEQSLHHQAEIENPMVLFLGHFDPAFVLVYLLPLFIIVLTYNVVSAERERGTLPLLLTQAVPFRNIMLHKIGLRGGLIAALAIGIPLALFTIFGVPAWSREVLGDYLYLSGLLLVYSFFWVGLAMVVNIFGKNSAFNAMSLVGIWVLLTLIVPALTNNIATSLHPVPSRIELINAQRSAALEAQENASKLLSGIYQDHPEYLPKEEQRDNFDLGVAIYTSISAVEKTTAPLEQQFDEQLAKQQRLVETYRFLSPAVVLQQELNRLSGNNQHRFNHFQQQVEAFKQEIKAYFDAKVFKKERLQVADYEQMPEFSYEPIPAQASVGFGVSNILALLLPTILFLYLAWRRLARVEAR